MFKLKNTKPLSATMEEWDNWEEKAKKEEPFAFWLNETVPEFFIRLKKDIVSPYDNVRYWIRYRLFDKYHIIDTGLKPGYADCDTRLLHGMFNLLVDFVEVESAWMYVVFDNKKKKERKHPWWSLGLTRFKSFRDPEAGLAYLEWEMSLNDPNLPDNERCDSQAQFAKEKLELYNWWKNIRPNRLDPMDASGWSAYCDKKRNFGYKLFHSDENIDPQLKLEGEIAIKELHRIEEEYDAEDEHMLIRLIHIRKGLWT
jgi:hypothetical protein